jgi:hypothetical protein
MNASTKEGELRLVIGHKTPTFKMWEYFQYFNASSDSHHINPKKLNLKTFKKTYPYDNNQLSEYYHLFQLLNFLEKNEAEYNYIILAHYRRFIYSKRIGNPTNTLHETQITPEEAENLNPSGPEECQGNDALVGQPVAFQGGMLAQYTRHHDLITLLGMYSSAVECGVLEPHEACEALTSRTFIPVASIGVFRLHYLLEQLRALENTLMLYHIKYGKVADLQNRTLGFCLERIHSSLHLKSRSQSLVRFGYRIVINESRVIKSSV